MSYDPIKLDGRRGMAAQKATERRREQHEVRADQAAIRSRQNDLEQNLAAAPAANWLEAAAKMRYLLRLFAASQEALDPRRKLLIESLNADLDRLST